ncbi:putative peptidase [Pseudooctadecabacter jejudonensis]|uniref:Putative peptidase n=2 Tax=Pseudooctadecabacter jejudonensis TaxID=1391910 RepID=A0A1Y5SXK6_9RHOB|nr:putative peptidase [Pseudooctadecabacter jejudonensis]
MPAMAQDFLLDVPVDCTLGTTCYIQNYVDQDSGPGAINFMCGGLTYDGHQGTDFAVPTLRDMNEGINVLAAAAGTVTGVRDGMDDVLYTEENAANLRGRDCGNGVVLRHDNGWETQYCHLALGSVTVTTGDFVASGTPLGQIGLSGRTQFPHVHLTVRQNGVVVDPFDPNEDASCTAPNVATLWADPLASPQGGMLASGFSTGIPEYSDVKAGTASAEVLSPTAPIVVWGYAFGARPDDVMSIEINGPLGPIFYTENTLDREQALVFRAGGRNPPEDGWPSGLYVGHVAHLRGGIELGRQSVEITLP